MKWLLIVLVLIAAPSVSWAQEDPDYDEDPPVTYTCDPTELLILYNRSDDNVKMHCSQPIVCGKDKVKDFVKHIKDFSEMIINFRHVSRVQDPHVKLNPSTWLAFRNNLTEGK